MMAEFIRFVDESLFWQKAMDILYSLHIINLRVSVSGGSSANILNHLNKEFDHFAWKFWLVDERCVPHDHPNSNFALIRDKLSGLNTSLFGYDFNMDLKESLKAYESTLIPDKNGYLFDCTILGTGPDGHIASLFPRGSELDSEEVLVTSQTEVFDVKQRIGLTYNSIKNSREILVLLCGKSKKSVFEKLKEDMDWHDFPVKRLTEWDNVTFLFLDK
jgi:6-phosphogluconolactonase